MEKVLEFKIRIKIYRIIWQIFNNNKKNLLIIVC